MSNYLRVVGAWEAHLVVLFLAALDRLRRDVRLVAEQLLALYGVPQDVLHDIGDNGDGDGGVRGCRDERR
mgnify:CR=1 FL=1